MHIGQSINIKNETMLGLGLGPVEVEDRGVATLRVGGEAEKKERVKRWVLHFYHLILIAKQGKI